MLRVQAEHDAKVSGYERARADRKLTRLPLHVNDEAFADALVAAWREVAASAERQPSARTYAPHR